MNEAEALRAYFDAHMAMNAAHTTTLFAEAAAQANKARDRLLQLDREVAMQLQSSCKDAASPT